MGQQTLNNRETFGVIRNKINDNFTELYGKVNYTWGFRYDPATKQILSYLGGLSSYSPGDTIPDSALPCHANIRCALQNEDGTINYFLNDGDWSKKADGSAADLTGADGDVVQVIPKIYEKFEITTEGYYEYLWSMFPLNGFTVHPAFWDGTQELDYVCAAVYKAHKDSGTGKLQSISGVKATTNITRAQFRVAAELSNSFVQSFYVWDLRVKLIACESGTYDVQSAIGKGITDVDSGDWGTYNSYYPIINEGEGNSLASGTGTVDVTVDDFPTVGNSITVQVVKWRGLENFYGHLWEFVDGVNILNHEADEASYAYLCFNPDNFTDDTVTNYNNKGSLALADNYWDQALVNGLMLPSRVTGSSSTGMASYYYTRYNDLEVGFGTDWRVLLVGGSAYDGSLAGFFVYANLDSACDSAHIGARLCRKFEAE
jgi:hypothetical protein